MMFHLQDKVCGIRRSRVAMFTVAAQMPQACTRRVCRMLDFKNPRKSKRNVIQMNGSGCGGGARRRQWAASALCAAWSSSPCKTKEEHGVNHERAWLCAAWDVSHALRRARITRPIAPMLRWRLHSPARRRGGTNGWPLLCPAQHLFRSPTCRPS